MSKHTSAPWGIGQNAMGHWMITAEESEHQRGYVAVLATTNTQSETNARLIAAAPEMLELLKQIADWPFPFLSGAGIDEVRGLAGEMVKKVEGEE